MKTIARLSVVLLLPLLANALACAQEDRDPFRGIPVTAEQKREIVRRIIHWNFAPRSKPTIVPLLRDGIDPAWLPEIPNLSFRLIELHQIGEFDRDIRFFHALEREGRTYFISLGKGDPECDAGGETWAFRLDRGRVRLWPVRGAGWGTGCGGTRTPPKIPDLEVGTVSPNELRGYQFFGSGKLKTVRLGVSRREDMIKLFGGSCEGPCDYDEDWTVWVNYFEKDNCGSQSVGDQTTKYCPKEEYWGTLSFVCLSPKKRISFSKFQFPVAFYKGESYAIADSFSSKGFEGAVHTKIINYEDSYGLRYEVHGRETFRNIPGQSDSDPGDLIGVQYEIPNSFESSVYQPFPEKKATQDRR